MGWDPAFMEAATSTNHPISYACKQSAIRSFGIFYEAATLAGMLQSTVFGMIYY